ncbi:MAG TPA: hypothetical protein VGN36_00065 [Sphingorhabdus sp.]|jgi:uncharacterized protein YciI|nr:hypothetical protein [Sphingorhabdus sp.]
MRQLLTAILLVISAGVPQAVSAQGTQQVSASSLQLVVFNRPGEKWAERAKATPLLLAHRDIYLKLAESGDIVFSGRFVGEPLLGMSIFNASVDEAAIQKQLESDPAVTAGYIALEFRLFAANFAKAPEATGKQP